MIAPNNATNTIQDIILSLGEGKLSENRTVKKTANPSISDLFDKTVILTFLSAFRHSKVGNDHLPAIEFKELLCNYLSENQVEQIYKKIDVNDDGYVSFMEFIDFLIASEAGTILAHALHAAKLKKHMEQMDDPRTVHRDMIDHICFSPNPMPVIISGGRDGNVQLWDPNELGLICRIKHDDKNSVFMENLMQGMTSTQKAKCLKSSIGKDLREQMAITSMCVLQKSGHLCVGSADAAVTVYDLGTQEVIGRITTLREIPSAMITFPHQSIIYDKMTVEELEHHPIWKRKLDHVIAIGGSEGGLYLYRINPDFGTFSDAGAKKKNEVLMKEGLKAPAYMGKIHSDWISRLIHISEADFIASASMDCMINMFDINHNSVSRVYTGHAKSSGVKSISYSPSQKYVVSAADRLIEVWDAFTIELVYSMPELESPIVDVQICDDEELIIASSTDKVVHLWNAITFELLQTLYDHTVYRPIDVLSSMYYIKERQQMITAGNRLASWLLQKGSHTDRNPDSDGDICSVLCNTVFMLIIVITSLGGVDVYQAQSGSLVRRFLVAGAKSIENKKISKQKELMDPHSGLQQAVVKFGCLDKRQRRVLIVTHDDRVELWNINNAQFLCEFRPAIASGLSVGGSAINASKSLGGSFGTTAAKKDSICCIAYDSILSSKKGKGVKKYIIVGTELGFVYGCEEFTADIDNTPTITFKRPLKSLPKSLAETGLTELDDDDSISLHGKSSSSLPTLGYTNKKRNSMHPALQTHVMSVSDASVVCIESAAESKSLVSFGDGRFFLWDILNPQSSIEFDLKATGPILQCMSNFNATDVAALRGEQEESTNQAAIEAAQSAEADALKGPVIARREARAAVANGERKDHELPTNFNQHTNRTLLRHRTQDYQQQPHQQQQLKLLSPSNGTFRREATLGNALQAKKPDASMLSRSSLRIIDASAIRNHSMLSGRIISLQGSDNASQLSSAASQGAHNHVQLAKMMLEDISKVHVEQASDGDSLGNSPLSRKASVRAVPPTDAAPPPSGAILSGSKPSINRKQRMSERFKIKAGLISSVPSSDSTGLLCVAEESEDVTTESIDDHCEQDEEAESKQRSDPLLPPIKEEASNSPSMFNRKHRLSRLMSISDASTALIKPVTEANSESTVAMVAEANEINEVIGEYVVALKEDSIATRSFQDEHLVQKPRPSAPSIQGPSRRSMRSSAVHLQSEMRQMRIHSISKTEKLLRTSFIAEKPSQKGHATTMPPSSPNEHVEESDANDMRHKLAVMNREGEILSHHQQQLHSSEVGAVTSDVHPAVLSEMEVNGQPTTDFKQIDEDLDLEALSLLDMDNTAVCEEFEQDALSEEEQAPIIVESCVMMRTVGAIIAACSDGLIRFWDLENTEILCSCAYYSELPETTEAEPASENTSKTPGKGIAKGTQNKRSRSKRPTIDKLKHIILNDEEDRLIGAHDSGMLRVWVVVAHSLLTMQKLLRIATHTAVVNRRVAVAGGDHSAVAASALSSSSDANGGAASMLGSGMAISPLQFLFEWEAHTSPILSISFVHFELDDNQLGEDEHDDASPSSPSSPGNRKESVADLDSSDDKPAHTRRRRNNRNRRIFVEELHNVSMDDGFIVSTGLDQQVALWTLIGECVGRYGSEMWDINDMRTWHISNRQDLFESSATYTSIVLESTLSTDAPIHRKIRQQTENEKKQLLIKRMRLRGARATSLNDYVRSLVTKINSRPPLSHEQNKQFSSTLNEHPIVNVDKFIAESENFASTRIAKRMAKFRWN